MNIYVHIRKYKGERGEGFRVPYIYVDICTHLCMCVPVGAGKEVGVECV